MVNDNILLNSFLTNQFRYTKLQVYQLNNIILKDHNSNNFNFLHMKICRC